MSIDSFNGKKNKKENKNKRKKKNKKNQNASSAPKKNSQGSSKARTSKPVVSEENIQYDSDETIISESVITTPFQENPITSQEQNPELFWFDKRRSASIDQIVELEIPSLCRREYISSESLINKLYQVEKIESPQASLYDYLEQSPLTSIDEKIQYYQYDKQWHNRLIQGDSLLVMIALLEQENMAGKVQTIYIDPPYGIQYSASWQVRMKAAFKATVKGEQIAREPEQIKAFRDNWQFGTHSYLSYLRDRLIVAKELLAETGACFVQISDENMHLVHCIMDEIFGRGNFIANIVLRTRSNTRAKYLSTLNDYILFYAKNHKQLKYHQLYKKKDLDVQRFNLVEMDDGQVVTTRSLKKIDPSLRLFAREKIQSTTGANTTRQSFEFQDQVFDPVPGCGWRGSSEYMQRLADRGRLFIQGKSIRYKYYFNDFPLMEITNLWSDQMSESNKSFAVQTAYKVIQRCLLMTTDPGDLILDPTCGSGTTAYVAEQWGRRWITIDTSPIALNIAKIRLMTATYPYYLLKDEQKKQIYQGFIYQTIDRITSKTIAYDETPQEETLYDKAKEDKKRWRVTSPFYVETLQSQTTPVTGKKEGYWNCDSQMMKAFEQRLFAHLKSAGVKNGFKKEQATFTRVRRLKNQRWLHAQGFYKVQGVEKKAYFYIGPQFDIVSQSAVEQAIIACQQQGDAQWLIILGFSFANTIKNQMVTVESQDIVSTNEKNEKNKKVESFAVIMVQMHDDLLQTDLSKSDRKAASFISLGEPKILCHQQNSSTAQLEIVGIEIYNPMIHTFTKRSYHDIAYWMIDENYNEQYFQANQLFLGGKNQNEFEQWQKNLNQLAKESKRKKNADQQKIKITVDEEAFKRLYGYTSHPITIKHQGQKVAVRVISQWGEESTSIVTL